MISLKKIYMLLYGKLIKKDYLYKKMTKKISIILKKNYSNIGNKGKIFHVSQGYALNYLIPNNIAEIASKKKIKHIKMFQEINKKQNEIDNIENLKLKETLEKINHIIINKKKGEGKNFFGSINEKEITNILTLYTSKIFEKKQIQITIIKKIGISNIHINLSNNLTCILKLYILPENI